MLAVYPGSFDPPTVAHRAIAHAALAHVDEVRFVLSEVALGKAHLPPDRVTVAVRRAVLGQLAAGDPRLSVAVTTAGLVADICAEAGADAVVVGADKWAQVLDPTWYGGSTSARDAALRRLPRVLVAARSPAGARGAASPGAEVVAARPSATPVGRPIDGGAALPATVDLEVVHLALDEAHREVSSTRARTGEPHLMDPSARASGHWT